MTTYKGTTIFTDHWNVKGLMYCEDIDKSLESSGFEFTKWTFNIRRLKACLEAINHILESLSRLEENIDYAEREAVDVYVARKKNGNFGIILLKPYVAKKGIHIALAGLDVKVLDSDDEDDEEEADD